MASLSVPFQAARELGLRRMALYTRYQFALRSGHLKRLTPLGVWRGAPPTNWLRTGLSAGPEALLRARRQSEARFFFDSVPDLKVCLQAAFPQGEKAARQVADAILDGRFPLFGQVRRLGNPPDWDAFAGHPELPPLPLDRHWTEYDLDVLASDIKLLWEPSRFAWAVHLGRAYRWSAEQAYAEAFWSLVESWMQANAPNAGPHWISAQEVALRLLAFIFGCQACAPALIGDSKRTAATLEFVYVHAARLPHTLDYARAQDNNHLLSEAAGLLCAGVLFPELRPAAGWEVLGRRWLEHALAGQVFPDGGYVQHSSNYQRLALQIGLYAAQVANLNGRPLSQPAMQALGRLAQGLAALADPQSGQGPRFGPHDGALFLPLSACEFEDLRPTLSLAEAILDQEPTWEPGPWSEAACWLGAVKPQAVNPLNDGAAAQSAAQAAQTPDPTTNPERLENQPSAGLYFIRGPESWAALRCAHFRSRPGHSDQLHIDLWWHGLNLALDPGTYRYNARDPWNNSLSPAEAHNSVLLDECDPMQRAGRFLWLRWAQGQLLARRRSANAGLEALVAEQHGYRRAGLRQRRALARFGSRHWLVVDDILGQGRHHAQLRWNLPDLPWKLSKSSLYLDAPAGPVELEIEAPGASLALFRAGEAIAGEAKRPRPTFGWQAPGYDHLKPALTLIAALEAQLPLRLISHWRLGAHSAQARTIGWKPPGVGAFPWTHLAWGDETLDT